MRPASNVNSPGGSLTRIVAPAVNSHRAGHWPGHSADGSGSRQVPLARALARQRVGTSYIERDGSRSKHWRPKATASATRRPGSPKWQPGHPAELRGLYGRATRPDKRIIGLNSSQRLCEGFCRIHSLNVSSQQMPKPPGYNISQILPLMTPPW